MSPLLNYGEQADAERDLISCSAWRGFKDGVAQVCGWCPDKAVADLHALNLGLRINHGLCEACQAKYFPEVPRRGAEEHSCAVGSATARRDGQPLIEGGAL